MTVPSVMMMVVVMVMAVPATTLAIAATFIAPLPVASALTPVLPGVLMRAARRGVGIAACRVGSGLRQSGAGQSRQCQGQY
jgi:hypothetical protein